MIYPSADALENWGSKYSLVVLAAKRAKQLKSGAPPLIETSSRNTLTIALEEIAAGKIFCQVADHDILPKNTQEAEVAQLLAIPTVSLDEENAGEEEKEAIAIFSDDELLADETKEVDEHAEELDEEAIAKAETDEDTEPAEAVEELEPIVEEAPKPKRGRKKKESTDEPTADEPTD